MKSLGRDMQTTTGAISKEDWALVTEMAQKIARHAEPPLSERKLVLDWLGSDSELFEQLDEHTHEVARAMRQAAESGDGPEVIENFARLQNSCLACHQRFRKSIRRALLRGKPMNPVPHAETTRTGQQDTPAQSSSRPSCDGLLPTSAGCGGESFIGQIEPRVRQAYPHRNA